MMYPIEKAQPVWGKNTAPDTYLMFRKCFSADNAEKTRLEISADSTFEVRLNGSLLPLQQTADFPDDRTFSSADVTAFLKNGENRIEVLVHYLGDDFLTYRKGVPYLQLAVSTEKKLLTVTGPDWEYTEETPYRSGLNCKVTLQLGFVFEYNALCEPEHWYPVVPAPVAGTLSLRRVPQLEEREMPPALLVSAGPLIRLEEKQTFARSCSADYLQNVLPGELWGGPEGRNEKPQLGTGEHFAFPPLTRFPGANGYYATIDLGCETVGYLSLELEAPAGTVVDIAHGEHLDDGRVRAAINYRNFADRFVCRAGKNRLVCRHRRIGARYLELHITNAGAGEVVLHDTRLIPLVLPLPAAAEFRCSDRVLEKLHQLSVKTLQLCMHEHYEDCPWREQGLYAYDSRNQILTGYYVWGNWAFAGASLDLLGKSFDGKRYLTLTSPGKHKLTIPIFTMVWVTELFEYECFSGSSALFARWQETVDRILDAALADTVPGHEEFYQPGNAPGVWNFCEWQKNFSHIDAQPQSVYNLYLREALLAAAAMHKRAGNTGRGSLLQDKAEKLGSALVREFLHEKGAVAANTPMYTAELSEHVQSLFLTAGLIPPEKVSSIVGSIGDKSMLEITLSGYIYLIRGLSSAGAAGRKLLAERFREVFEPILFSGASSIWETADGGSAFDFAGSLCHGWSAVFPFYSGSVILGVTPLEPGFTKFRVRPCCCGLEHAEGTIPTPHGLIHIRWRKNDRGLADVEVRHPACCTCVFDEYDEFPLGERKDIVERSVPHIA